MLIRYGTRRKFFTFPALAVLVALLLAACGSSSTPSTNSTSSSEAQNVPVNANATVTETPSTSGGSVAVATLKSAPTGSITLNWNHTTKMLTVQTTLSGLAPNSVHPAQLYQGSCNEQGKMLYALNKLVADAHGMADVTTNLSLPEGIPANGWYMNVHNGPGLAPADQAASIACSNITAHDTALKNGQSVEIPLQSGATISPNENAGGVVHLSIVENALKVQLVMTGLEPNSQHVAHIHAGSCAKQGAVVYHLPVIKADSAGKATVTTTIPNVSTIPATGWYVNVHRGTDLSTQTGFDPIACGDVVLSNA
ncbi:MAG TPA: CHRD domain-containing protein [Ktedonobacteraceae bacterium]|nr:CHRD domain-containing protein [Ktedonobacteraceae bacterium]